jgi:peptidoglycan/LPS O-acetylase OafA/YrhL
MIEQRRRRVPVPVLAAAALISLAAMALLVDTLASNGSAMVLGFMVGLLVLGLAHGVWRGSGRARFWATVLATAGIVYALVPFGGLDTARVTQLVVASVVVVLLMVPVSSRRWFGDPSRR